MAQSVIKKEFANHYVAFGKGNEKLGEREDIDELAIIALQSGDRSLIKLFEKLPTLEELQGKKTDAQLKEGPKAQNKESK